MSFQELGGRFTIIEESIYAFDSKEFAIKVFSKEGKFQFSKKIKGEGPGEILTLGSIFADEKNVLIIETIRKKWVRYDHKLNFLSEGKYDEPINYLKRTGLGIVGGVASFGDRYYRKLLLFKNNFEKLKEIFREYGENFRGKIISNELYITFDANDEFIAFASGNSNKIKLIDYEGNLKKVITLKVKASEYKEEELSSIFKNLPQEAKELIEFKLYPYILQILFINKDELLIITGEFAKKNAKSYIYDWKKDLIKKSFQASAGFYQLSGDILYSLLANESGCIIREIPLSEVLK